MNNLTVPVAHILRRLFNVVSVLAISQHYIGCPVKPNFSFRRDSAVAEGASQYNDISVSSLQTSIEAETQPGLSFRETLQKHSILLGQNTKDSSYGRLSRLMSDLLSGLGEYYRQKITRNYSVDHTLLSLGINEGTITPSEDAFEAPQASPTRTSAKYTSNSLRQTPDAPSEPPRDPKDPSPIQQLLLNPTLFDPVRKPRYPIVLCHGLYGFDVRGPSSFPSLQMHYWSNVLKVLKKTVGAEVFVTGVPGTGSVASRAHAMHSYLLSRASGRALNFMAHSMGGLDCRYLISRVRKDIEEGRKPEDIDRGTIRANIPENGICDGENEILDAWRDFEGHSEHETNAEDAEIRKGTYVPVSLTTICTPHRGSPVMDWFVENIGIGKPPQAVTSTSPGQANDNDDAAKRSASLSVLASLPSSFTTLLLSILDTPAYANLTTSYVNDTFNPSTPDDPRVRYYSVGATIDNLSVLHPLYFPKMVIDRAEEKAKKAGLQSNSKNWGNDGLVSVNSAQWGEFLGVAEDCDHWTIRGSRGFGIDGSSMSSHMPSISWNLNSLGEVVPSSIWNSFGEFGLWQRRETRKPGGDGNGGDGGGINWLDLTRFVRVWKREEARVAQASLEGASSGNSPGDSSVVNINASSSSSQDNTPPRAHHSRPTKDLDASSEPDEVVKASTDKLSKVFDWIVEQSDSTGPNTNSSGGAGTQESEKVSGPSAEEIPASSSEHLNYGKSQQLPHPMVYPVTTSSRVDTPTHSTGTQPTKEPSSSPKFDLERFYVALCRKLYDDGL